MPDQSSAATEHAILQEITAPLARLPDDPVSIVHADFPVALRGYDRMAVDAYVKRISQLVAELQSTRSPDAAVRRALERVGEQISGILQRAHETAEQITSQSRAEAEDRLEQARREAAQIVAGAEQRLGELDSDTDRIWSERHRIVGDARELAAQLVGLADDAAQRFPPADEIGEPALPYDDQAHRDDRAQARAADRDDDDRDATVAFPAVGSAEGRARDGESASQDPAFASEDPVRPPAEATDSASEPPATHPPLAFQERPDDAADATAVIPPASQAAHRRGGNR